MRSGVPMPSPMRPVEALFSFRLKLPTTLRLGPGATKRWTDAQGGQILAAAFDRKPARLDSNALTLILSGMSSVLRELKRYVRRFEPCLPRPAKQPPAGKDWIHEIKHDGFRIMAWRDGDELRLLSRKGYDLTDRFQHAAAAMAAFRQYGRPSASDLCRRFYAWPSKLKAGCDSMRPVDDKRARRKHARYA